MLSAGRSCGVPKTVVGLSEQIRWLRVVSVRRRRMQGRRSGASEDDDACENDKRGTCRYAAVHVRRCIEHGVKEKDFTSTFGDTGGCGNGLASGPKHVQMVRWNMHHFEDITSRRLRGY